MPVKRLPRSLKRRLKKAAPVIERRLGRMKNIDSRQNMGIELPPKDASNFGWRVREMGVSRNYPKVQLVIKRVHDYNAEYTIKILKKKVRAHNRQYSPRNYVLVEPKAYAISEKLVAMEKTDAPSVAEIIGLKGEWGDKTKRGQRFWGKLKSRLGSWLAFWKRWKLRKSALRKAARQVFVRTGIYETNLLLLGYKNGKFVFMPLIDIY